MKTDNILPQSIEAEQSLLGGLMLDARKFDDISDIVSAGDFYAQNHKLIYQAIIDLVTDSKQVDVLTVAEQLGGNREMAGGLAYIGTLASNTPSTANIKSYAQIVRNKAVEREILIASQKIHEVVHTDKPTSDKANEAEKLILNATQEREITGPKLITDILPSVLDEIERRSEAKSGMVGIPTGFKRLDNLTQGLEDGNLIILAGRPSMGKTTLALNVAEDVAIQQRKTALVFSLEMSDKSLVMRSMSSLSGLNMGAVRSGNLQDEGWNHLTSSCRLMENTNLIIDDSSALTALQVKTRARRVKRQHGLDLIVVDYLQLMDMGRDNTERRDLQVGAITRQLKLTAKELNVPIILLSQLNRQLENRPNKRPRMADLRESGAIEQDADIILFVYRDEVYNPDTDDEGLAEIIVSKQRNGQLGTVTLEFQGNAVRFVNTEITAAGYTEKPKPATKGFTRSNGAVDKAQH